MEAEVYIETIHSPFAPLYCILIHRAPEPYADLRANASQDGCWPRRAKLPELVDGISPHGELHVVQARGDPSHAAP